MKKQLSATDIAARSARVRGISSVVPLERAPAEALRYYTGLTDVKLRTMREPQWGIYIAESSKVVRRALKAGHRPLSFLMSEKWAADLADVLLSNPQVPAYIGSQQQLERVTGFHLHRGALAVMARPAPSDTHHILAGARRAAVLEDIVDHTNVGAIFRSAAALGVDAVLVSPRCADPLYRRAIRVSMGSVFQVPWARLDTWPDTDILHRHGFTTAALALEDDSTPLDEFPVRRYPKLALILGTEGHGLAPATVAGAQHTVMIPMLAGVDSLNVGAAAAVAFWQTRGVGL